MTMKIGMMTTEISKPVEEHVSLQWGHYKRRRLFRSGVIPSVQRPDLPVLPDSCFSKRLSAMHVKAPLAEEAHAKREMEYRNGQTRRRTELESLHDKHLVMKKLNLAVSKWPKLLISLSQKEKEHDFMVMKGSQLPQRPQKRAKHVEKVAMYVSPGSWLCEVSLDRYEVREKKSSRRKPSGLKAMESLDSDSG